MSFGYLFNDQQKNPNILINGDMAIAQRQLSVALSTSGNFVADRWNTFISGTTAGTTSQNSASGLNGLPSFSRVQRTAGNTGTGFLNIAQTIETPVAKKLQGRFLTLSFWARAGANFSGTSSGLSITVTTGTGTDETPRSNYTGQSLPLQIAASGNVISTAWKQYSYSVLMPANTNEACVTFAYAGTGTAGANDYFDITGVSLNEGGLQPYANATNSFQEELALCQRFYQKTFPLGTPPVQNSTNVANAYIYEVKVGGVFNDRYTIPYIVLMRVIPSITFYNPSAANGKWRNISASVDSGTPSTGAGNGTNGFEIVSGQLSGDGQGTELAIHYTADAEIF